MFCFTKQREKAPPNRTQRTMRRKVDKRSPHYHYLNLCIDQLMIAGYVGGMCDRGASFLCVHNSAILSLHKPGTP